MGWTALAINQGATPGLGSYLAGHRGVGLLQMALSVSGFIVIMVWFWELLRGAWKAYRPATRCLGPPRKG